MNMIIHVPRSVFFSESNIIWDFVVVVFFKFWRKVDK